MIDGLTGMNIPGKCPKIGVRLCAGKPMDLMLQGDPFHFGAYLPGDEYLACEYTLPGGSLGQYTRGRTVGNVLYNGLQCLMFVEDERTTDGEPILRSRRILHVGSTFVETLLVFIRRTDGSGFIENTRLELPLRMNSRSRWRVVETDDSGDQRITRRRIDGVYDVTIGKKRVRCVRWIRMHAGSEYAFEEAQEIFVSVDTGLTVLVRNYKGRGWPNWEVLKKNPRIEIQGHIFYLWSVRLVLRNG